MIHHKDKLEESAKKDCVYAFAEKKGQLAPFRIITEASGEVRGRCCFGCKAFYAKQCYWPKHIEECTKKTEHGAYLKSILPQAVALEALEMTGGADCDAMKKLMEEVETLKKRIVKLERELKTTDEMYDDAAAERDHVVKAVIATTDRGIRKDMVHYLQKTPAEYDKMADFIADYNWDVLLQTDSDAEYRGYCREYWSGRPRKNEIHRYEEEEDESDKTSED